MSQLSMLEDTVSFTIFYHMHVTLLFKQCLYAGTLYMQFVSFLPIIYMYSWWNVFALDHEGLRFLLLSPGEPLSHLHVHILYVHCNLMLHGYMLFLTVRNPHHVHLEKQERKFQVSHLGEHLFNCFNSFNCFSRYMYALYYTCTVEPLYSRHPWNSLK